MKQQLDEIRGYVMVPPKMEITEELKDELRGLEGNVVTENKRLLGEEVRKMERTLEKKMSVLQANITQEIKNFVQEVIMNRDSEESVQRKLENTKRELRGSQQKEREMKEDLDNTRKKLTDLQ